jgi:hypothetical protein
MSLANSALLNSLALQGTPLQDCETAGGATGSTVQAGATAIIGTAIRVLRGAAGTSLIQKSVLSGDAAPQVFVINDGPNSINVYPAPGEFNNGTANQVLACPAGQSQTWIRVPNNLAGSSSGWRSCVVP